MVRLVSRTSKQRFSKRKTALRDVCLILVLIFLNSSCEGFIICKVKRKITLYESAASEDNEIGVGIDLGTTRSAVAYLKDGIPTIIPITDNGRTMPSVVSFGKDKVYVGEVACQKESTLGAYRNVKRILGTGGKLSPDLVKLVPFLQPSNVGKTFKKDNLTNRLHDAKENPSLLRSTTNENEPILPEVISSHILSTLKSEAESHTGKTVSRAVIGVPAYFNDAQRESTKRAAEMAGISKVKLLREPEAAALAYGIGKEQVGFGDDDELVLVFDLGGGTFDVSMLLVGGGLTEIISTSGNISLGGADFDGEIATYFMKLLNLHNCSTNQWAAAAKNAIILAAEAVRIYLSNNKRANVKLPKREEDWARMSNVQSVIIRDYNALNFPENGSSNQTHVMFEFTRKSMEKLCKDKFQALLRPVREVAVMSGALLPGDTSPALVEAALEFEEDPSASQIAFDDFYKDDNSAKDELSPDVLLHIQELEMKTSKKAQQQGRKKARDVAKQEKKYRTEKRKLQESMNSAAIDGVKIRDGISGRPISRVVLVGGATRMPGIGRLLTSLTGVVPQKTVNPDEAVALGCAVHVGILDGKEGMGTVLTSMQAAILRAMAEQRQELVQEDFDDGDFDDVAYF